MFWAGSVVSPLLSILIEYIRELLFDCLGGKSNFVYAYEVSEEAETWDTSYVFLSWVSFMIAPGDRILLSYLELGDVVSSRG